MRKAYCIMALSILSLFLFSLISPFLGIASAEGYQGPGGYEGRAGGYEGRAGGYEGRAGGYEGRAGGYEGRAGGYEGRAGGYEGIGGNQSPGGYKGSGPNTPPPDATPVPDQNPASGSDSGSGPNAEAPNTNQGSSSAPNSNQGSSNNNLASLILRGIKLSSPAGFAANLLWDAFGDEIIAGASWFAENVFPVLKDRTLHIWNFLKYVSEFLPINLIKDKISEFKETWFPEEDPRPHGTLADVKHISDSEYLAAAELAYEPDPSNLSEDEKEKRNEYQKLLDDEGWAEIEDINIKISPINGFGGKAFVNHDKKTVMIAFRGTEPPDHRGWRQFLYDALIDLQLSLGFNDNIQLRSAQELIDQVKNDPKYKDYQLVLTGHSLGGWIGAKKGIENKIPTVTFNAPGIQNNLTGEEQGKNRAGKYNDLIRNYVNPNDVIGTFGKHAGETYYMLEDGMVKIPERHLDDDKIPILLEKAWNYGFTGKHGLEEFEKEINVEGNFEGVVR